MGYKCRTLKPTESRWFEIESSSANEAANEFHLRESPYGIKSYDYWRPLADGGHEIVRFALVEVEGHEPVVSRVFFLGIYRRGRLPIVTLADIAQKLGWTHPVEDLLGDWEDEEKT